VIFITGVMYICIWMETLFDVTCMKLRWRFLLAQVNEYFWTHIEVIWGWSLGYSLTFTGLWWIQPF